MGNKSDKNQLFKPPNPKEVFDCSSIIKSKGFTLLMKLVLLTKENLFLEDYISEYIINNPEEINKVNEKGWMVF